MSRFLIGIDLGTTNSALAYVDLKATKKAGANPTVHTLPIPQLVGPGEIGKRSLLPSFLYLPGEHDLPPGATAVPWDGQCHHAVGEFARNQGARVPGRLATSAKSWLCHAGVDRSAPLLPWSAPPEVQRLSPVEVSTRYLRHLVDAWNYEMAREHPEDRLEKQAVVLTVPASFDDIARALTVDAAKKAGLENLTLLEEPQAAFYCWLSTHPPQEAAQLKPGDFCLVIDVGGGTSDFSLIQAVEQQGGLGFVRQAVGDHLLLGGDNMDLALAKFVEAKMPGAGRLDAAQYGMLTQACRQAKEVLLSPNPPATQTVTVMGRGRKVVGGAEHATLTPEDVHRILCDGFLPDVPRDAEPARGARTGLHEMGLPYVSDAGITRHLAAFVKRHTVGQTFLSAAADRNVCPTAPQAILFNGGVFQPEVLRQRVIDVMRHWYAGPGQPWQPLVLSNPSLDLAVAWGAAYYAWLRHTGGKRIGGGMARSYYIAVETQPQSASAEVARQLTVVCVVPQHLEEGAEVVLTQPELELALGQPVAFPLHTSTVRANDKAGDLLQVASDQLLQLPPLHTILRGGKRSGTKNVPVTLAARSTEIGTLELWCAAKEGSNRWRLEFNVRDIVKDPGDSADETDGRGAEQQLTDVWPEAQVEEAARLIRGSFSDAGEPTPRDLTKALEAALDAPRDKWPTGLCRRLWDFLAEAAEERRRSPAHLGRWFNLVGFSLRPGFGDSLDKYRVEQLWKMLQSPPRQPAGAKKPAPRPLEGGADYWIMWRRVAGGLNVALQTTLYNRLRAVLLPSKTKAVAKPNANELAEMWRAAASLERIDVKQKEQLGPVLLKQVRRSPVPTYSFFALTRLGARVLLYGPLNAVVHHEVVEGWLDAILPFEPGNDSERLAWAFCLAQLARRSGQRALDVDDSHRRSVLIVLGSQKVPAHWVQMVEEVTELESEEQSQMFGDSLPIGLRLVRSDEQQ